MIASPSRLSAARFVAGYGAVASALPYLALKIVWLGGGTLGVVDRGMMRETSMVALNAVTAGMDAVGIALALAFTHRWGLRIPAWLLLPPMWVASGLLATFVLGVPVVAMLSALAPASAAGLAGGPVEAWVNVLVYLEFAGLGTGLTVAFVLYARRRWAEVFQPPAPVLRSGVSGVQVVLANASALVAAALGVLYLAWAFGAGVGLPEDAVARRTMIGSVLNGISALLAMTASAGVLMMVHRIGTSLPAWLPLSMAWVGTGSLFGWGLWPTVNVLGQTALMQGAEGRAFVNLVGLVRLNVGLIMGLLTVLAIEERHRAAGTAPVH